MKTLIVLLTLFSAHAFATGLNDDLISECRKDKQSECKKLLEGCENKDAEACYQLANQINNGDASHDNDVKALLGLAYRYKK